MDLVKRKLDDSTSNSLVESKRMKSGEVATFQVSLECHQLEILPKIKLLGNQEDLKLASPDYASYRTSGRSVHLSVQSLR